MTLTNTNNGCIVVNHDDLETTLTSSEGIELQLGQTTTITYKGMSPKNGIRETNTASEITLWLNGEIIDSARTCSPIRGAYFDATYMFAAVTAGDFTFEMKGGYRGEPASDLTCLAQLTIHVRE